MKQTHQTYLFVSLLTLLGLVLAYWLGEFGLNLGQLMTACLLGFAWSVGVIGFMVFKLRRRHWVLNVAMCLGLFTLFTWSLQAGQTSYAHAYNACVTNEAEDTRKALLQHYQSHQSYPEHLNHLALATPCARDLHPSLLQYQRSGTHFKLWFDDGFVSHEATDLHALDAHK